MSQFTQLDPSDYSRVSPLLAPLSGLHGSVPAVLAGTAEGRVMVDDARSPAAVLLDGPEGLYLGGDATAVRDWAALRASIQPFAYLYPADAWLPVIDKVLPHPFMLRHQRVTLSLDLTNAPSRAAGHERFEVRPMADGVGAEVLDGDVMVAHCHEDMVVGDRIEVGVWTDARYRRQGLARLAVAGAIAAAQERGLRRMGWHCLASNAGSLSTALSSGFSIVGEYVAYGACLTAENRDDLDLGQWLELASHFERGASQYQWMAVYSAEALSAADQANEALGALERLVEMGWDGKAEWLEGSWALAPLRDDPRFVRVIARQREGAGAS